MDNNEVNALADFLDGKGEATVATLQPPVETPQAPPAPVETPVAVETPTTPPNTPPPAQPQFDLDAELVKITNGSIKSKDEIAGLIERSNKVTDFENRFKTLEEENTSLKAKVNTDPFANDFTKRLNELYKSGANDSQIQAFTQLNKVDLDTLSPVEAKVLALQMQHKLTQDEARDYVKNSYKLNPEEYDEETIKAENIRLKVDAMADRTFLNTHKAEVSAAPVNDVEKQQQELQQKATEHVQKLTPIADNVLNNLSFKGLSLNGKTGDANIVADFEVSEASKAGLKPLVEQYIQNNWENLPANEKGQEAIKTYAENVLAIQNWRNWIVNAASARELQVRAEYNNPTPVNRGVDVTNRRSTTKEDFDKQLLDTY